MKILMLLFLLPVPFILTAQDYSFVFLPDSLTKNADAIKRIDETYLIIKSEENAIVKHKVAYTILNENGNYLAEYHNVYDKYDKIVDITARLYDKFGKKIKSAKKKDFDDVAFDDNFSLVTDARMKHYSFFWKDYPYTVEYEDEEELNGYAGLPYWHPVTRHYVSVQNSSFIMDVPVDYLFQFKAVNFSKPPLVAESGKRKILTWDIKNYPAVKEEVYQPQLSRITPSVLLRPGKFIYAGHTGNMATWKSYGEFYRDLYYGRDILPEDIKATVHKLADTISGVYGKTKALYEYLQKNSRYISIQLGIGGLQPFEASFVAEKKYGDCKALSNYMVALLKEAGIRANVVIVNGDEDNSNPVVEDFPMSYFNHVIACVPNGKDTIWLECTSQSLSPGYVGSFTCNRKALLIDSDGGHLVSTPVYTYKDNRLSRYISASIDENGTLKAEVQSRYSGLEQDNLHYLINSISPEKRMKYLNSLYDLPTYQIDKTTFSETRGTMPYIDESLVLTAINYSSVTGKRIFVRPNVLVEKRHKMMNTDKRISDVFVDNSYQAIDSVRIAIPQGYKLESLPKGCKLETKFGTYEFSPKFNNGILWLYRYYYQKEGVYPSGDYVELEKFQNLIYSTDHSTVVFVKTTVE